MPSHIFRLRRRQSDEAFFRHDLRNGDGRRKLEILNQGCHNLEEQLNEDGTIPRAIALRVRASSPIETPLYRGDDTIPRIDLLWLHHGLHVNLSPIRQYFGRMRTDPNMQVHDPLWVFGPIVGGSRPELTAWVVATRSGLYCKHGYYQLQKSPHKIL